MFQFNILYFFVKIQFKQQYYYLLENIKKHIKLHVSICNIMVPTFGHDNLCIIYKIFVYYILFYISYI